MLPISWWIASLNFPGSLRSNGNEAWYVVSGVRPSLGAATRCNSVDLGCRRRGQAPDGAAPEDGRTPGCPNPTLGLGALPALVGLKRDDAQRGQRDFG